MAGRQDEAVAVGPMGIGGVEFQELGEQHGGDVGRAHRQAGMAGIGLLHRIHAEGADGIGHGAGAVGGNRVIWREPLGLAYKLAPLITPGPRKSMVDDGPSNHFATLRLRLAPCIW